MVQLAFLKVRAELMKLENRVLNSLVARVVEKQVFRESEELGQGTC